MPRHAAHLLQHAPIADIARRQLATAHRLRGVPEPILIDQQNGMIRWCVHGSTFSVQCRPARFHGPCNQSMTDTDKNKPTARTIPETSYKETAESIIIAFILAFVFRAFVVEAFVIPTGSMAPTLLGKHVTLTCPQCGYHYPVGPSDGSNPAPIQGRVYPLQVDCPMCRYPVYQEPRSLDAGDRILVLKYIYGFSEPKRWDVVVFKNPEKPGENYIKRLVGLPKEKLLIVHGNIYTQPIDDNPENDDQWTIQRKTDRPKVQCAVWQPVYHSAYVPLGGEAVEAKTKDQHAWTWKSPWHAPPDQTQRWQPLQGGRAFRYRGGGTGRLDFSYRHPAGARDYNPYNDLPHYAYGTRIVEDMRLGVTVQGESADTGLTLVLETSRYDFRAVIDPQSDRPRIEVRGNGFADWTVPDADCPDGAEKFHRKAALAQDRPTRVELWHVDQHVQLWMDGELAADWAYDNKLGLKTLRELNRKAIQDEPRLAVTLEGGPAVLHNLQVDRDLYYTNAPIIPNDSFLGTMDRIAEIGDDRFYCLGDNSPQSRDSRMWATVDKWIRYRSRELGHEVDAGYVPRELMLGRAFFVYFPAPYRFKATGPWLIPDFGKLRFIH